MVESYSLIQNRLRLGSNALVKQSGETPGHGADFTAADGAAIHLSDGGKFAHRPGAEPVSYTHLTLPTICSV